MFKGYVETKDKKCLSTFKNKSTDQLLTLKEANKLNEYAGILSEDTILIDIDDFNQSEILMDIVDDLQLNCRVYATTRGKHFLFKNSKNLISKCYTHTKLACGIEADIKVGSRNSYSILKFNGKEREIIYDIFDDEEYAEVPKFLYPIKSSIDFLNLGEGDGRNQSLFNYILTLQSNDFNKSQVRECLTLINKYVLPESLTDKELEIIMRDEAFKKESFFVGNAFLHDKFATYLMNNACIRKINNQLHVYRDGVYIKGKSYIEQEMIKRISRLKVSHRTEVLKYLELIVPEAKISSANLIAFNNGIYDITRNVLLPFDSDIVITNKIPWDFNPNAYSEIADKTLNKLACFDDSVRCLLEECIGYCFYRRNELRKSFMLVGDKKNGKSTFLDMVYNLLGEDNVATLDLNEIGDKFLTAELNGTLANIGDDIDDKYVGRTGVLKKVISGSKVQAQKKGQDPFKLKPYSKFLFSANEIPRFKDKTGAVLDRLVIIPFKAIFTKQDPDFDPYIKYKLEKAEVMEYLILIGIEGLKRILENNCFTTTAEIEQELKEFNEQNNPIQLFFDELTEDDIVNKVAKDVYTRYSLWCTESGLKELGYLEFTKMVKKTFNVEITPRKINGTSVRIYIK